MSRYTLAEGSTAHRTYRWVTWGAFAVLAFVIPFWAVQTPSLSVGTSSFTFSLGNLTQAVSYMVGILGLGLLVGFNGQISLGNSFFMGVGAYLTTTLVEDNHWPYLLTLVVVLPVTFIVGMLVGLPALRIRGLYLALTTLGLAAVFPALVRLEQVRDQTGGANGKRISSELAAPSWLHLDSIGKFLAGIPLIGDWLFGSGRIGGRDAADIWVYFLLAILAAAAFWVTRNLIYSRPGRSIIAIRDNETGAAISGVNLAKTKTLTFGMSAALGGLAGTMYAMAVQFVAPDVFGLNLAIFLIVGLVVGGVGTLTGPLIGGLVIIFVPLWTSQIQSVPAVPERFLRGPTGTFFLGFLLIVLTFFLPGGIVYGARRIRARFVTVMPSHPAGRATAATDAAIGEREEGAEEVLDRHDPAATSSATSSRQSTNHQGETP